MQWVPKTRVSAPPPPLLPGVFLIGFGWGRDANLGQSGQLSSGYVRKYFDVKKRAFLRNFLRDFGRLYA